MRKVLFEGKVLLEEAYEVENKVAHDKGKQMVEASDLETPITMSKFDLEEEIVNTSLVHEAPTNAESQGRIETHWVYCAQFYFVLQETIFVTRTRNLKVI